MVELIQRECGGSRIPHPLGWGCRAQFIFSEKSAYYLQEQEPYRKWY